MVTGINHITFAVRDLEKAIAFYRDTLGMTLRATWDTGAYLTAGVAWVALNVDPNEMSEPPNGGSHIAFTVAPEEFEAVTERILRAGAEVWRENRSEGASLYFTDPDGHKLEIHVSDLAARLAAMATDPPPGFQAYCEGAGLGKSRPP